MPLESCRTILPDDARNAKKGGLTILSDSLAVRTYWQEALGYTVRRVRLRGSGTQKTKPSAVSAPASAESMKTSW
jgi:hypothetical protein